MRSLLRAAYRAAFRADCKRLMNASARSGSLPLPLRDALAAAAAGSLAADARIRLDAIEKLRKRLDASTEPIDVLDFGAASSPDVHRTEEQMQRGVTVRVTLGQCSRASKDNLWGTFLFQLVRNYSCKSALELGTDLGISAAYQAAAMVLNGGGQLVTCEGAPALADRSRANLKELDLSNVDVVTGKFTDTLPDVCEHYGPFDFVFIDGHHDETATVAYFDTIVPHATPGAVIVLDDIEWSEGMRSAWNRVQQHPRVNVGVGLRQLGVCILNGKG